jgi:hypothetical protein
MTRRAALSLLASAAVPMLSPERITIDDVIANFLRNCSSFTVRATSYDNGRVEQTVVIHRRSTS